MRIVVGVDVGTQGVRVLAATTEGEVVAKAQKAFEVAPAPDPTIHEQDPRLWWQVTTECLRQIVEALARQGAAARDIVAVCVASTSGTILLVMEGGVTMGGAIMYNDGRAVKEAKEINAVAGGQCATHGYRFSASFALAKILWLKRHHLTFFKAAWKILHATDYISGKLTGDFGKTDLSSALKTGCDLINERWPAFIEEKLGIPLEKLPELGASGRVIGTVSEKCAAETGLSTETKVCAGMTDGTAAFLASGAAKVGDFNSTLGTTLVLKGNWERILVDPKGRIYSHKHPAGWWLPGGASNVGGECLAVRFEGRDLQALDRAATKCAPTDLVIYPLVRQGERLPFMNPGANGFIADAQGPVDVVKCEEDVYYAAHLEGVAYVERMCYEVIESLGAWVNPEIYTTGAASKSKEWRRIRASVLNRSLAVPKYTDTAFGCCVLAAANTVYADLASASKAMVRVVERTAPEKRWVRAYQERYERFKEICRGRGYL
jgi:xylulokinase